MAKAAGPPKKKSEKQTQIDKEQSERFKKTARELGVDERSDCFETQFSKIVQTKKSSG